MTITELENRRDKLAGDVAEKQMLLDSLDGNEELVSVQKLVVDLDASTRLLQALDRQLGAAYEAQRAEAYAAREQRRQLAATQAAQIRGKLQSQLFPVYALAEQLEAVTSEFSEQFAAATSTRLQVLSLMRAVGIDVQVTPGAGISHVRK